MSHSVSQSWNPFWTHQIRHKLLIYILDRSIIFDLFDGIRKRSEPQIQGMSEREIKSFLNLSKQIDAQLILKAIPGSYLILLADAPHFTIIGATDSYLADTFLKREDAIGRGVFETLADDPGNRDATGVKNLMASLYNVLEHKREDDMADQRYNVYNPHTRQWEHRMWRPLNKPVMDEAGNIQYIIHWVEEVTEKTRLETQVKQTAEKLAASESRFRNMVELAPIVITLTRGQDIVIESINASMLQLMNKPSEEDVIGKKMTDVLPELIGQPAFQRVQNVQATGKPFQGDELPVDLTIGGKLERDTLTFPIQPLWSRGKRPLCCT